MPSRASRTNLKNGHLWNPVEINRMCFGCLVFTAMMALAQGVGTSGEITGTVTDTAGNVLLKVHRHRCGCTDWPDALDCYDR